MKTAIFSFIIETPDTKIESRAFGVDKMTAKESAYERRSGQESPLKIFFDYWASSPTFEPFDHPDIWVQSIDVSSESPFGYVLHRHTGLTFGDLSGCNVGSLPHRYLRQACALEYSAAKRSGQPVYHLIEQSMSGIYRKYTRLMIPTPENVIYYVNRIIVPPTALRDLPYANTLDEPPSFLGA